jgi:hypothetical protein
MHIWGWEEKICITSEETCLYALCIKMARENIFLFSICIRKTSIFGDT